MSQDAKSLQKRIIRLLRRTEGKQIGDDLYIHLQDTLDAVDWVFDGELRKRQASPALQAAIDEEKRHEQEANKS